MITAPGLDTPDRVALDEWYAVAAVDELRAGAERIVTLLGMKLRLGRSESGISVRHADGTPLPSQSRFSFLWTTLGDPAGDPFDIPEYAEPDRRNLSGGSIGVRTSAPRAVENFLDLGHLPFVHADYLGVPPKAEIKPYDVAVSADEILATRCRVFQPRASLVATEGYEVEYIYRVPHPYCAVLYKSSAIDTDRMDVIAILVQPVDHERSVAHMMVSVLDDVSSDQEIRAFQQFIFGQDKPILENQVPRRLPLDPRAEMPARVDAISVQYRRWLRQRGVSYGTLP